MKATFFTIACLFINFLAISQIQTTITETRAIYTSGVFKSPSPTKITNLSFNADEELAQINENESKGLNFPYRFAKGVDVDYNLDNSGEWFDIVGGRVWKLCLKSEKAYSLSLIFSKVNLTESSEMNIYNGDGTMIFGPITRENLPAVDGALYSDVLKGNIITIELYETAKNKNTSVIQLVRVVQGFRDIFQNQQTVIDGFNNSLSCEDDVACNSNWSNVSNGVVMILVAGMQSTCSGSLLNDQCQDFTPYVLTAFHCVDIGNDPNNINYCTNTEAGNGSLTALEKSNVSNWVFRFQYKRSTCNSGPAPTTYYTFQGATFRSAWNSSDFALVQMEQNPAASTTGSGIKYLGWTRLANAPSYGALIGHPLGDVI